MTTRFWHPFADMAVAAGDELVLDRGEGVWLWDEAGNRYLDSTAALWYCNVGHGRSELAAAASAQMTRLAACSNFDRLANRRALDLAERVAARAPMKDAVVFFTSGGSESVDTAAKMVRRYWAVTGKPERQTIVVREHAYHGMAGYGTSLAGIPGNYSGFGELVPGVVRVPADDLKALRQVFEEGEGRIAAFFGEPVIGAGGVRPPAEGYWKAVADLCRRSDVLLVVDEVVTGFGRLGEWFASTRYGIEPDLVTGAKGVTSGYVPLGVVICGPRIQEPFWRGNAGLFRHGYTYSGHPTACAVGLANLDILEREALVDRVRTLEPVLAREVGRLRSHPAVAEVRAAGLLAGVELSPERLQSAGYLDRVVKEAGRRGVLTRALVGKALQISPPFVITEDQIRGLVDTLSAAFDAASS
ncbi:MAG TPA: aminotransferase class III-fold pyridoxal phosphate-dependent enzyme [Vicinamibacteria bacterium]